MPQRRRRARSNRRRSRGHGRPRAAPPARPRGRRRRAVRPARRSSGGRPAGSVTRQLRSTTTSSARPPSTDTPWRREKPVRHSWVSPARQRSHAPHHTLGCTATAVPSSRTPANSCPRVTGMFHPARWRSELQMPHAATRTRTGSSACSGTVASICTTPTPPSPVARTARMVGESCTASRPGGRAVDPTTVSGGNRRRSSTGVERPWRTSDSTVGWRSSPAQAADSGASTPCCSRAAGRSSS